MIASVHTVDCSKAYIEKRQIKSKNIVFPFSTASYKKRTLMVPMLNVIIYNKDIYFCISELNLYLYLK
jgi:hypothetical protein